MDKKMKVTLMIVLVGIVVILGILCFRGFGATETIQEEKILYEYTQANGVEYAVNLKPNEVYEVDKLPEGQMYLTEFVKDINTYFTSTFTGSEAATIKGEYEIVAQVAGYVTEQEIKTDVWSKNFVLVPKQSFEGEGTDYKVEKTVSVNYQSYDEFARAVAEVTKVNLPMELRVIMTGNMSANTAYGVVEKPIQTSVVIPLGSSYFTMTTDGEAENKDSMKETVEIIVPVGGTMMIIYGILIGVVIIVFIGICLLVGELNLEDTNRKKIKRILTTYGSRMIGVDDIAEEGYKTTYKLKSIEDLIKIADEIEKPLLYKYRKDELQINNFYVMDEDVLYTWRIELETEVKQKVQETIHEENHTEIGL